MPVIIAHGQPKSGSTFLFRTVCEAISQVEGQEFYSLWASLMGQGVNVYFETVTPEDLGRLTERAGERTVVIKTHAALSDDVREMVERGDVRAFTSFRDPRDACRSMLDAGISDREKGSTRWFATKTKSSELVRPIAYQCRMLQSWMNCPKVLALPYYLIANDQDYTVRRLCDHLGFSGIGHLVSTHMDETKASVPEYHKGISDRFLEDFNWPEIEFLNKALAPEIAQYEKHLLPRMEEFGHQSLCAQLIHMRDERLRQLESEQAA